MTSPTFMGNTVSSVERPDNLRSLRTNGLNSTWETSHGKIKGQVATPLFTPMNITYKQLNSTTINKIFETHRFMFGSQKALKKLNIINIQISKLLSF